MAKLTGGRDNGSNGSGRATASVRRPGKETSLVSALPLEWMREKFLWVGALRIRAWALLAELALSAASYLLTVLVLVEQEGSGWAWQVLTNSLPQLLGLRLAGYLIVGLFKRPLRYASSPDLISIVKAVSFSSAIFFACARFGLFGVYLPASLVVLDWILLQFLLGGLHFGVQVYRTQMAIHRKSGRRVLVVGVGDAGHTVLREIAFDSECPLRPVAIIDEDPEKRGSTICGVPVLGGLKDLPRLAREKQAEEVLICIPSATRAQMSAILARCREASLPVKTLPSLARLAGANVVALRDLRSVRLEDLLQREEVPPDPAVAREVVEGRTVLVTGAGGSIGSELCRQIAAARPKNLLMLDKAENSLFYIDLEIHERFPDRRTTPLLVDITRRELVGELFRRERPEVVFHAAAHKHVHLLELHPLEAIRNNVLGTRNVALAARETECERFVNISSDKAVDPQNYMGLSKKITELCIHELARRAGTRFMNVRFGNVAGSTGSVLRLFRDQIRKGRPIRVSDPRATRYFMTISEAVCLILHAATQGQGGETFVFDMGEPLNIYELARTLSLFSGLAPGKDLPIQFIGLKSGEKISEVLWEPWEHPRPTAHKRILVVSSPGAPPGNILARIDELEAQMASGDHEGMLKLILGLFPEFAAKHGPGPRKALPRAATMEEAAS